MDFIEFQGSNCLRQRIILATLTRRKIIIDQIRDRNSSSYGVQKYEISLLKLLEKITMGPYEDSNDCPISKGCAPEVQKRLSNYYNKALVLDQMHQWLISCGSLFQGACTAHSLYNISRIIDQPQEPVVANNATASTVAFIAPGPDPHKQVLYVGATYTAGSYRSDLPVVSSRSLFETSKSLLTFIIFYQMLLHTKKTLLRS